MQNAATPIFYAGLFAGIYDAASGILLHHLPTYLTIYLRVESFRGFSSLRPPFPFLSLFLCLSLPFRFGISTDSTVFLIFPLIFVPRHVAFCTSETDTSRALFFSCVPQDGLLSPFDIDSSPFTDTDLQQS